MSRHNRERRRPGLAKVRAYVEPPGENERANMRHRRNLAFYRVIRAVQENANATQSRHFADEVTDQPDARFVSVRFYPQHWTEGYR